MVKKQLDSKQLIIQAALDKDKETSKTYFKFKQSIRQTTTLRAYNHALDRFMILSNLKSYDGAIKIKPHKIQDLLENYIISLKNHRFQTANQRLAGVELFFDMNMVLYHKKILRKLLPNNDKISGGRLPYTTEEIQRMLSVTTKLRSKAIIHYFASTGCRPASIEDPILCLKHIEEMPHNCKSVLIYDGSKQGYYAFLTPEASKALDNYLNQRKRNGEILNDELPVFANVASFPTTKKNNLSQNSARQIIRDTLNKAGIDRTKTGERFDKAEIYGFRKRFNTTLKLDNDINSNIAEKLMAHTRGLDGTYMQPTKLECFAEFVKAIPQLTIDQSEKHKAKIESLEVEKTELEKKNQDIENMKEEIKRINLRNDISDLLRQKIIEWAEINPDITALQAAKIDFGTSNKFETLVEHYLKVHDGDISELKQRIVNAQIKTREN